MAGIDGGDGGSGDFCDAIFVVHRAGVRHGVIGVGHAADEGGDASGLRCSDGSPPPLVDGTAVCSAGVDEQRVHRAVEQDDLAFGFFARQGCELVDAADGNAGRGQGSVVRRGHGAAEGRDVKSGVASGGRADVTAGPGRHGHGHDKDGVRTI